MEIPQFDIDYYELPIDNNDQYDVQLAEGTKLLVIYTEESSAESLDKLGDILKATKIPADQIGKLPIKKISLSLAPLLRNTYIAAVISFGVHPFNLGMKIPNNKYYAHKLEDFIFIYSDSLERLKDDKVLKGKLWSSIKTHVLKTTA